MYLTLPKPHHIHGIYIGFHARVRLRLSRIVRCRGTSHPHDLNTGSRHKWTRVREDSEVQRKRAVTCISEGGLTISGISPQTKRLYSYPHRSTRLWRERVAQLRSIFFKSSKIFNIYLYLYLYLVVLHLSLSIIYLPCNAGCTAARSWTEQRN